MLKDILLGHGYDGRMWVVAHDSSHDKVWVVGHTSCGSVIHRRSYKSLKNALYYFLSQVDFVTTKL